ncbi:MAG: efflux RND transporter permease subunit [Deltaproteobacteria bacterium]|nr:efflux RND transporter permease subunit [Deltaproteobacteria bacterium]
MRIVELSLRRRVTVAMGAVALVLFGLVAFSRLQVSLLPELTYPSITIETRLPGAAPIAVEQLITRPIEERIGVVSGARRVASVSRPGLSLVTVEFSWDRDMDFAAIDVREKLDRLRLPDGAEAPVLERFDPAADPVMRLFVTGSSDLHALRETAEQVVEKDLESTLGVAAIDVEGGYQDEIEIVVDPGRLSLTGLSVAEVGTALAKANVDQAGGSLFEREARYLVRAHNRFADVEDVSRTVLTYREGRQVTIADVADVHRTHRQRETITRLAGAEAVQLSVFKEGDANTTAVAQVIAERLEQVRERLPAGVEVVIASDQSSFIRDAVDEVLGSALWGGVFAVLVLLMFLRDVRSTIIISTAIPVSVVATFFLMYRTGTTLNVMSLGGLALGVGMLVDNAIVVLESIHRHREAGASIITAAREGASEVGQAVVASTLTTVAVFLPVVFLDGVAAQLFRDMAVTVCFSLLASLVVSLTMIPMLTVSLAEAGPTVERGGWVLRVLAFPVRVLRLAVAAVVDAVTFLARPLVFGFEMVLAAGTRRYPGLLRSGVRRPFVVMGIAAVMFGGTAALVPRLGLDLLPSLSQGEFSYRVELDEGTPLPITDALVTEASAVLDEDPRVLRVASTVGRGALGRAASAEGSHTGSIVVKMVPGTTAAQEAVVIERLGAALDQPAVRRFALERPTLFSLSRPIEIELRGDDPAVVGAASERIRDRLAAVGGVVEARASADAGHPEVAVRFDRERLSARGLDVAAVAETMRQQLQGQVSTALREGSIDVDIRVRAVPRDGAEVADIETMVVGRAGDRPIRLADVTTIERGRGPAEIHRRAQTRVVVVSANIRDRDMGAVAAEVEAAIEALSLPAEVRVQMSGQQPEMSAALEALLMAMALAGFLVYLVMAAQFESLVHPFVVILTLPLAFIGVVVALFLTGSSVSVISMIGMVMLAGIVVNNAIVLVDAINRRRRSGQPMLDAIVAAGQARLRPILMTSATTVLGLLPMALATGSGAELRQALALSVIGGLAVATVLTLVVIPAVYSVLGQGALRPINEPLPPSPGPVGGAVPPLGGMAVSMDGPSVSPGQQVGEPQSSAASETVVAALGEQASPGQRVGEPQSSAASKTVVAASGERPSPASTGQRVGEPQSSASSETVVAALGEPPSPASPSELADEPQSSSPPEGSP